MNTSTDLVVLLNGLLENLAAVFQQLLAQFTAALGGLLNALIPF